MTHTKTPVGIMLVNFGVPDGIDEKSVGKFMRSYVADGRVFGFFGLLLHDILHWTRRRTIEKESAARYYDLYDKDHFPYTTISASLRKKVDSCLKSMGVDNAEVIMSFRYGEPNMRDGFKYLEDKGCKRIIVMPLYPQSSYEFTASVHDEFAREQRGFSRGMEFRFVDNFYDNPLYISAVVHKIRESLDLNNSNIKIVFAFRAIPLRDIAHGDTYELQTSATALSVANELELERKRWTISYIPYSHLDDYETLKPDIDETVERFALGKVRDVAVVCPGQIVDSVDTLYEVDERMRQRFEASFASDYERCNFVYVPALNDSDMFAHAIASILLENMGGWESHYCLDYQNDSPKHAKVQDYETKYDNSRTGVSTNSDVPSHGANASKNLPEI